MGGGIIGGGIEPPQEPPLQDIAEPPLMSIGGAELPIMLPVQDDPEHCAGGGGCCPHSHGLLRLATLMKERMLSPLPQLHLESRRP